MISGRRRPSDIGALTYDARLLQGAGNGATKSEMRADHCCSIACWLIPMFYRRYAAIFGMAFGNLEEAAATAFSRL